MPIVELIFDPDCPNVEQTRARLRQAFAKVGELPQWKEWNRGPAEIPAYVNRYGSPTVLIDGRDVGGLPPAGERRSPRSMRSGKERAQNPGRRRRENIASTRCSQPAAQRAALGVPQRKLQTGTATYGEGHHRHSGHRQQSAQGPRRPRRFGTLSVSVADALRTGKLRRRRQSRPRGAAPRECVEIETSQRALCEAGNLLRTGAGAGTVPSAKHRRPRSGSSSGITI